MRRILHKGLGMTTYKVQLVQELKPIDHPMRFRFAKWACARLIEDSALLDPSVGISNKTKYEQIFIR